MSQKLLLFTLLISMVSLTTAQYKPPLYMGFLMPKKYVRNLTNMQSKTKSNCGSVCPQQTLGSQIPFNNYNLQVVDNLFTNDLPSQQFSHYNTDNFPNDFKPLPKVLSNFQQQQWEKAPFNKNFVPNFVKNEPQMIAATRSLCCAQRPAELNDSNNSQRSNFMTTYNQQPIALNNPYSNTSSRQINSYTGKSRWDSEITSMSPSPFDQWIRQQQQEGSYVLYTGSQLQQPNAQSTHLNKFGSGDTFLSSNGPIAGVYSQSGKMRFN